MNPTLPFIPQLPDEPAVGTFYRRPRVRAHWPTTRIHWLPVLGPIHSDREHIKADSQHLHVDYRFLNLEIRQSLDDLIHDSGDIRCINRVYSTTISHVWPRGHDEPVELDKIHLMEIDPSSWMSVRPRKYQGPYPPYPHGYFSWLHNLSQAYAERTLINGTICPHRGTDLSGIASDDSGVITCPLHGLRWFASTGNIVKPGHIVSPVDQQQGSEQVTRSRSISP